MPPSVSQPAPSARASARGKLRLFIDSASEADWRQLLPSGAFCGVTTNPTILERAGRQCTVSACVELARDALRSPHCEEVMLQAWGGSAREMVLTGEALANADRARVIVKVPATLAGVEAAAALVDLGIRVCLTAVYRPAQMLAAMSVGAEYAAPYVGRMCDAGRDGEASTGAMRAAQLAANSSTRVLVASVRSVEVLERLAAEHGCDTFTLAPAVCAEMLQDELSVAAAAEFEAAAERRGGAPDLRTLARLDDDTDFELPPM